MAGVCGGDGESSQEVRYLDIRGTYRKILKFCRRVEQKKRGYKSAECVRCAW